MTQTGRIRTDGATLYYERRGSGPALLMISGGGGDAAYYSGVGDALADAYTVLTYDRRGNSRSTVDDRSLPMSIAEQSADALAVLAHHDLESAVVFGGSGGALIGLDLTARSPASVQGLIAHEPPVLPLLTDADRALFEEIYEISRREGPLQAWVRFVTTVDHADSPALVRSPFGRRLVTGATRAGRAAFRYGPRSLREVSRFLGNSEYLMSREVGPFLEFEPDFAALKASGVPIVVGVGAESRPYYPARGGEVVAARLGVPVVEFPGPHAGYAEKPAEFAVTLRKVLADMKEPAH
jgi:pimeloyl-ACP methyl ester carboxylesterase